MIQKVENKTIERNVTQTITLLMLLFFIATSLFAQEYTGTDLNHTTIGLTKDMISDSLVNLKAKTVNIAADGQSMLMDRIRLQSDGAVKWGNSANQGYLSWDVNKAIVGSQAGNALGLYIGNSQKALLSTDGKFGIGKTPTEMLDVNGNIIGNNILANNETRLVTLETYNSIDYNLLLPDTIYSAIGKQANIYFENLGLDVPSHLYWDVSASVGDQYQRWWRNTATVGIGNNYSMSIYLKNSQNLPIDTITSNIKIVNGDSLYHKTYILCIGDSRTNSNYWTNELSVLGGDSLSFIGTQDAGTSSANEGYSGKTWAWFLDDVSSPFRFNSKFDYNKYLDTNSLYSPDVVIIRLGTNDVFSQTDAAISSKMTAIFNDADSILNVIHNYNPACKIGLVLETPPPPSQDGYGYALHGNNYLRMQYAKNIHYYNQQLINKYGANGTDKKSYISLIPFSNGLDIVYGYPTVKIPVNEYSTDSIYIYTNDVHENESGYRQEGAIAFSWLSHLRARLPYFRTDFSGSADGFSTTTGTLAYNVHNVSDGNIEISDVLKFTCSASSGYHFITHSTGIFDIDSVSTFRMFYYIPSTNTNIDGFYVWSGDATTAIYDARSTVGTKATVGQWTELTKTFTPSKVGVRIYMHDGSSQFFQDTVGDDIFYLAYIKVTGEQ